MSLFSSLSLLPSFLHCVFRYLDVCHTWGRGEGEGKWGILILTLWSQLLSINCYVGWLFVRRLNDF